MRITKTKLSLFVIGLTCLAGVVGAEDCDGFHPLNCEETCDPECDGEDLGGNIILRAPSSRDLYPQYCQFPTTDCGYAENCGRYGVWLPECPVLFRPFLDNRGRSHILLAGALTTRCWQKM